MSEPQRRLAAPIVWLFTGTLLLSSFLLFLAQPLQAKMLLPLLGGTPAVWNACMLFFQVALLGAYFYAHVVSTRLSLRWQFIVHALVLLAPLAFLPQYLPADLIADGARTDAPLGWLLIALTLSIGPAFFAIATTSPLLQTWFVRAGDRTANPYPLYAASNVGSLLALLGYPLVVEPLLPVGQQAVVWTAAYAVLVALIGIAGWMARRAPAPAAAIEAAPVVASVADEGDDEEEAAPAAWVEPDEEAPTRRQHLYWVLLAALPSSLMLGVTTFLTTDIAAVPMLWVLPLALYTLSFVMVFARYGAASDRLVGWLVPICVAPTLLLIWTESRQMLWLIVAIHLTTFFVVAVAAHGRLALAKPAPRYLTAFYFCLALGGVLGGAFNTLVAPQVFTRIVEYPLVLVLAVIICRPRNRAAEPRGLWAWLAPVVAAMASMTVMGALIVAYDRSLLDGFTLRFVEEDGWKFSDVRAFITFGVPLTLALLTLALRRPAVWAAAFAGVAALALSIDPFGIKTLHQSRSFFGVLTVNRYELPHVHSLVHGGILHGEQRMATAEERAEPRSYYHREGPLGQIMRVLDELVQEPHIGAIGLGTGAIAAYGHRNNRITFFELDPNVEKVARDPKLFTYIDDCIKRWCKVNVVIGDGRLKLAESPDAYDLIVVDAFSSDAIPVHLLTLEAVKLYFSKMTSAGVLAFHISNRYVDLEPVLLNIAKELSLGYAARTEEDDEEIGKGGSTWVLLAADNGLFDKIAINDDRWGGLIDKDGVGLWRDDYANILRAFTWW